MGNTILLADKSITIQKIVQLTFADDNYNIHSVSDGQVALDMIPHIRPDLLLADISLPVKSGYDVCTALRTDPRFSAFSKIPVILLAGIYETMDEDRARQVEERVKAVEATDFLSKPFDPQLLISKVKQYLSTSSPEQPPELPAFSEGADSAINLFDSDAPNISEDAEKTMMLPGGPFGNLFESEPAAQEETIQPRPPVDIESVSPANEPVFGEESFSEIPLGSNEEEVSEEQDLIAQSTLKMKTPSFDDQHFVGREEQEFEYTSGPVLEVPQTAPEPESIPLILPNAEDPFGDVFQEPQSQWGSATASEEDSPFGVPEPPADLEIAEDDEEEATFEVQEESVAPVESQPEGVASSEVFDSWPGTSVKSMAHPVEDLFESDPGPLSMADDAQELEPDDSGSISIKQAPVANPETPASTQVTSAPSAQISEELIDRIAERVLNKLSERLVSEIVWQVVPDLAEKMIRRELEKLHAEE